MTLQSHEKKPPTEETPLLWVELLRVERRSQEQICWVMAGTIGVLTVLAHLVLDAAHFAVIRRIAWGLFAWFTASGLFVRYGSYHPNFKYVNLLVQVSMVTAVIYVDSLLRGPAYALSSMPPLFYGLVVAITSLTINPKLCLAAGLLAGAQLFGLYLFFLGPLVDPLEAKENPVAGWQITMMKAIVVVATGVAAMLVAMRARRLLQQVSEKVQSEEQLRLVENEMAKAAEVQSQLIPDRMPDHLQFDATSFYQPARKVGGDYLDVVERPDGSLIAVVADVSGKGYAAAITMAGVQGMLRILYERHRDPLAIVRSLNTTLCSTASEGRFVTLVYMEFDASGREIRYVNCGHNPPLLVGDEEEVLELDAGGPVLGVIEDAAYQVGSVPWKPGDLVFAYTDGLSELRDGRGRQFGVQRVIETLRARRHDDLDRVRERILERVESFAAGVPPQDDLTFMAIRNGTRLKVAAPPAEFHAGE